MPTSKPAISRRRGGYQPPDRTAGFREGWMMARRGAHTPPNRIAGTNRPAINAAPPPILS